MDAPTRGERNNNPGNIDYLPDIKFVGETGLEEVAPGARPRFATFDTPVHGIRALARNLLAYNKLHRLHTIREIITRWAPGNENDTAAYIDAVCKDTGYSPDLSLNLFETDTLMALVRAIIRHENGRCIYTQTTLKDGVKQAYDGFSV